MTKQTGNRCVFCTGKWESSDEKKKIVYQTIIPRTCTQNVLQEVIAMWRH